MVNKQLREERHHGDISLPVSGYRVQPPYSAHLGELECHWHSEMELFQVERGTMQVQCGSEYFEAKAGDLVFFNSGELHAAQPIHGSELDFAAVVFSPELLCGDENDIVRRRYVAPVVEGKAWPCAYVELGSPGLPHAVVPYPGLADADPQALFQLGKALRSHPAFPKGANVNFYESTGPDQVLEKTFERGVEDFTLACGTGTGSVVAVLTLLGQVSGQGVQVSMAGGVLTIDVARTGDRITGLWLTGPTNLVAKGEVFDEELLPSFSPCG